MSQRNHRVDRFAQMTKQEEIIAKKRQEILEKQKTAQLAKAVAAAQNLAAQLKTETPAVKVIANGEQEEEDAQNQDIAVQDTPLTAGEEGNGLEAGPIEATVSKGKLEDAVAPKTLNSFTGKTGKITFGQKRQQLPQPSVEQPPPKVKNTFCNDGSFLENFKKILEKHEKPPQPLLVPPVQMPSADENSTLETDTAENSSSQLEAAIAISSAAAMATSITVTSSAPTHLTFGLPVQAVQPPPPPPFSFNPALLQQGPPQMQLPAAFFHGHLPLHLHPAAVAPPPPPPPPQLPIALANMGQIYMQLGPTPVEAMQLNAIPAPKEFDLNAIPKPQINLEAIQMPTIGGHSAEQLGLLPEHMAMQVNPHPPPPPPPVLEEMEQQQPQPHLPQVVPPQPPQPAAAPQGFFMIRAASSTEAIAPNSLTTSASALNGNGSGSISS
ncbi:ras-associated and pleckstrin homology domains-containing protein 1 isoform X2 [Drosophila suzukii]|uniref:Ras-associated and pleckstrin homology domains-containing protein 1 isoform X2 n=1 Tax=Drosophila suzukii TaxID=28584 RepID=A0AB39ZLJ4_DROSZ|nr:formin-like protein 5 isoform X2 [Drosophila suzukii]